ncbi:MAG: hypothetical protein A3F10_04515 [Coxiella sp. RIFCSPHIGHO2_12_FULL_42_15]|nr:MAG: hypothetical protein A3F10_04515 [Coxiella sp. RIFCSPHIGHO2_12_FULL_42_15]
MRGPSLPTALVNVAKELLNEIYDPVIVATTLANYFTFPFSVTAYYSIANQVAEAVGCKNFKDALLGKVECSELQKIIILDSGGGWAEAGMFATVMVLSTILGILIGIGNLTKKKLFTAPAQEIAMTNIVRRADRLAPLSDEQRDRLAGVILNYHPASDIENASEEGVPSDDVLNYETWVKNIERKSYNAWMFSRTLLLPGLILGLPKMYYAGTKILTELGCAENYWKLTVLGHGDSEFCNIMVSYYSMGAFAYPWAILTWAGYAGWEFAFTYQCLPARLQKGFSFCVALVATLFKNLLQPCLPFFESILNYFQELIPHLVLWLKILTLLVLYPALYFVLTEGVDFSNQVLRAYECPPFFETFFASHFMENSLTCEPLEQILGMDAFPTETEVFRGGPAVAAVVLTVLVFGSLVSTLWITRTHDLAALRSRVDRGNEFFDQCIHVGKYSSLLFIFPSAYALFNIAIPKANDLLDRDGCSDSHYPIFIYDLFNNDCPILSRYRANGAFSSTMWMAFCYPGILAGSAGAGLYLLGKASRPVVSGARTCVQNAVQFFRPPMAARAVESSQTPYVQFEP